MWAVARVNRIKVKEEDDDSVDGERDMGSLLF